jgi:hypothetical protein
LVFKEKRHFFTENWEKLQKIVIITSTPGEQHRYIAGLPDGIFSNQKSHFG